MDCHVSVEGDSGNCCLHLSDVIAPTSRQRRTLGDSPRNCDRCLCESVLERGWERVEGVWTTIVANGRIVLSVHVFLTLLKTSSHDVLWGNIWLMNSEKISYLSEKRAMCKHVKVKLSLCLTN
jgi:hypothetical protein